MGVGGRGAVEQGKARVATAEQLVEVLRTVEDPEAPVNIVDLGLLERCEVAADGWVEVDLLPTRSSCPAREYLRSLVVQRIQEQFDVPGVRCRWVAGRWSVERLTPEGRKALQQFGVAVPERDRATSQIVVECPYCGSRRVRREARFGTSVCRSIWYCEGCRNPFEEMRWMQPDEAGEGAGACVPLLLQDWGSPGCG